MGLVARLRAYAGVMRRAKRPLEAPRLFRRRPALLLAVGAYETALLLSGRVEAHLTSLAQLKTSALVGCPF
jgi:alkylhydroperoxidase family enzyme